jgi:hypothetical protein
MRSSILVFATFLLVGSAEPVRAGESFYVMIFGSQSHPKQLRFTHTWATFIRAVGEGPDPSTYYVEYRTISWLPATLDVRVLAAHPEPGVNLDLYASIDTVLADRERITMWGPFVATKLIYDRAAAQVARLESGTVRYRAIDGSQDLTIDDCIHAVADIDPVFGRNHYPLVRIGKPASRYIAKQIKTRTPFDEDLYDNRWLITRFGLERYPIRIVSPRETPTLLILPRRADSGSGARPISIRAGEIRSGPV